MDNGSKVILTKQLNDWREALQENTPPHQSCAETLASILQVVSESGGTSRCWRSFQTEVM
jgi:hypothetical protein